MPRICVPKIWSVFCCRRSDPELNCDEIYYSNLSFRSSSLDPCMDLFFRSVHRIFSQEDLHIEPISFDAEACSDLIWSCRGFYPIFCCRNFRSEDLIRSFVTEDSNPKIWFEDLILMNQWFNAEVMMPGFDAENQIHNFRSDQAFVLIVDRAAIPRIRFKNCDAEACDSNGEWGRRWIVSTLDLGSVMI